MIELPVTLTSTGGAVSFASPVPLGYTKNKGVYRLLVTAEGEWEGLTIRCFWHLPGGADPASSLVQDGAVDVPASVTAHPGNGCITFEGSDGVKTVTSADLRYRVGSNSGTVKYGLLIRGGKLSAADRTVLVGELSIQHDLDLR